MLIPCQAAQRTLRTEFSSCAVYRKVIYPLHSQDSVDAIDHTDMKEKKKKNKSKNVKLPLQNSHRNRKQKPALVGVDTIGFF